MRNKPSHPQPESPEPSLKTIETQERSAEYSAFLKYAAQSTGVVSYEQLSVLYPAICQGAMEWLLREKKSVDFGFVILHPSPHRANWKQAMVALFPSLGPAMLGKPRAVRDAILTSSGFTTKMLSGELLAVAQERYVVWGIETELKRSWWKAMLRYEAAKFRKLGSTSYAAYIARSIVSLRAKLVRAYLSFLRQTSYPCARIQQSRLYRSGFIVPFVPKGKVRPVTDADIPVDLVVPRDPEKVVAPKLSDVVAANAEVPELPDLPQGVQDLRVPRRPDVERQRGD